MAQPEMPTGPVLSSPVTTGVAPGSCSLLSAASLLAPRSLLPWPLLPAPCAQRPHPPSEELFSPLPTQVARCLPEIWGAVTHVQEARGEGRGEAQTVAREPWAPRGGSRALPGGASVGISSRALERRAALRRRVLGTRERWAGALVYPRSSPVHYLSSLVCDKI